MTRIIAIAAAAIALGATAVSAEDLPTARVRYSDLNLASIEGQAMLHRRVSRAVNTVCGTFDPMRSLAQASEIAACRANAARTSSAQVAALVANSRLAQAKPAVTVASR